MSETLAESRNYFDWAATAPVDGEILREALEKNLECWGNPSSIHSEGKKARKALEEARERSARVLGVKSENLVWTSGGTESDHLALLSALTRIEKGHVVLSAIEHPALREMAREIENLGFEVTFVKPDRNGFVSVEDVMEAIRENTVLASVMAVNNETGAIQPYAEIGRQVAERCQGKRKIHFHVDAVQALGKIPLELSGTQIDSAAFSAHKICGPRGIGLLYMKKEFHSFLRGGGQEKNMRSGTENLFGAWAFMRCLEKYAITAQNQKMEERLSAQKAMCASFVERLSKIKGASIIPYGRLENPELEYSPWVVQASFAGIPGQVMLRALDAQGICISTGSACSSSKKGHPVLDAMSLGAKEKEGAVRFSFGHATTSEEMDFLLAKLEEFAKTFLG